MYETVKKPFSSHYIHMKNKLVYWENIFGENHFNLWWKSILKNLIESPLFLLWKWHPAQTSEILRYPTYHCITSDLIPIWSHLLMWAPHHLVRTSRCIRGSLWSMEPQSSWVHSISKAYTTVTVPRHHQG